MLGLGLLTWRCHKTPNQSIFSTLFGSFYPLIDIDFSKTSLKLAVWPPSMKSLLVNPMPTFRFVANEAHWLCWVDGVKGSTPVAAVTSSDTTPAPLHARRATVKRVAGRHSVVMVAVNKVVAPPIPTICRGRKEQWLCFHPTVSN